MNYYFRKQSSETVIKKLNSLQATASCVPQVDTVHGPLKHRTPGDRLVSQATHAHNLVSSFPVGVQISFE